MINKTLLIILVTIFGIQLMNAQQIVYSPRNPSFGAAQYNPTFMLQSADSQNKFEEDDDNQFEQKTELEQFKDNLNRQLLNRISQKLFDDQLGDSDFSPGTYTFGSLVVDIFPSNLGLTIDVLDTDTGEQTVVSLPNN